MYSRRWAGSRRDGLIGGKARRMEEGMEMLKETRMRTAVVGMEGWVGMSKKKVRSKPKSVN